MIQLFTHSAMRAGTPMTASDNASVQLSVKIPDGRVITVTAHKECVFVVHSSSHYRVNNLGDLVCAQMFCYWFMADSFNVP